MRQQPLGRAIWKRVIVWSRLWEAGQLQKEAQGEEGRLPNQKLPANLQDIFSFLPAKALQRNRAGIQRYRDSEKDKGQEMHKPGRLPGFVQLGHLQTHPGKLLQREGDNAGSDGVEGGGEEEEALLHEGACFRGSVCEREIQED